MFTNFEQQLIEINTININLVKGGKGPPLLLLHGYPQTYFMWHKIVDRLAEDFTVIAADLRGYGDSSKFKGKSDHSNYSKRVMAEDMVQVMSKLGFEQFYLVGHDRGARVAHRLTLDYPQSVLKLAVLDIVPTYQLYMTTDQEFASAYYHWFFLIQPYPFPETLIGANPDYFLNHCLKSWSKDFAAFTPLALQEYQRCFRQTPTIHSTCEDYRAGATIDMIHDGATQEQKITCPVLALWGGKGIIGRKYDVLSIWQERAINVQGKALNSGHFLPEEAPEATYQALREFLS